MSCNVCSPVARDHLLDVVGVPAELGQDEAGRQVQLHHTLQAERDVLGGQRLAAVEQHALADREVECQAVLADLPLLREVTDHLAGVGGIGNDQLAVDVAAAFVVGELVGLRRIETADDVVDLLGHHHDVLRCRCRGGTDDGRGRQVPRQRSRAECVVSACQSPFLLGLVISSSACSRASARRGSLIRPCPALRRHCSAAAWRTARDP